MRGAGDMAFGKQDMGSNFTMHLLLGQSCEYGGEVADAKVWQRGRWLLGPCPSVLSPWPGMRQHEKAIPHAPRHDYSGLWFIRL
jgi:hypothetical protein